MVTCEPGTVLAATGGLVGTSVSSMFRSHAAANCMGTYTSGPISGTCMSSAWGATNSVIVTALLLHKTHAFVLCVLTRPCTPSLRVDSHNLTTEVAFRGLLIMG